MAALIQSLAISGSRKADGSPNAGGRIFLTDPTAGTAVDGYTDRDASAVITLDGGGILLDGSGRRKIYVSASCTVTEYDSGGTLVASYAAGSDSSATNVEVLVPGWTGVDASGISASGGRTWLSVVLAALAASCGGDDGLVKIAAAATGRNIFTKFSEVQVSVKDYGAIGNGTNDDTAAIQAAANYVASLGGGVLYFPPGTYLVTAPILTTVGMSFLGAAPVGPAGLAVSIIKNSNAGANALTLAGTSISLRNLKITHATSSTGIGVSATTLSLFMYDCFVDGHLSGIVGVATGGTGITSFVNVSATSSGAGVAASSAIEAVVIGGKFNSTAGTAYLASGAKSTFVGTDFGSGSAVGLDVSSGSGVTATAYGCSSTATIGLRTGAATGAVMHYGCNFGAVTDGRTGAPVAYSFGTSQAVTPLPLQTDTVRVVATAAITVTVNAAAATGFGKKWTMMCANSSGGAVTWTFNAQYVLSAAVAPATGTMVNLLLEYDPISAKMREVGRAATAI